jgi:uncharacterized tellurite resistance protein B-like protein
MPEALIAFAVVLVAFVPVGILYGRFRASDPAIWKRRVLASVRDLEHRRRDADRDLVSRSVDDRRVRMEYLARHLRSVGVDEFVRYPGIGPATVSRLKDSGLTNLEAMSRGRLSAVPGIGPARQKDLRKAIEDARREAESRFDAGACPEAVAFAAERKKLDAEQVVRQAKAKRSIRETEAALAQLADVRQIASDITFLNFLRRRPVPALTEVVLQRPLTVAVITPEIEPPAPPPPVAVVVESPATVSSPLDRLRAVVRFGFAVAKADGRVAAVERRQVRAFAERRYAPSSELAGQLDILLNDAEGNVPSLSEAIREVREVVPSDGWPELHQFAISITDAAGERNTREIECLARVAEGLGIQAKVAPATVPVSPAMRPDAAFTELDCRAVLEIPARATLGVDLIRRQYRLLSDRFAVEKFASHGPEFIQMASEKRERIQRAATHLLAEYNEPLEPPQAVAPSDLRHNPDLDEVFGG